MLNNDNIKKYALVKKKSFEAYAKVFPVIKHSSFYLYSFIIVTADILSVVIFSKDIFSDFFS